MFMVVSVENEKLKIAFYWAASCGGYEVAVLGLNIEVHLKKEIVL